MATQVIMPVLGIAQEFGKIVRWLKHEGQTVNKGEPLLEVETDKAVVEIEAPASGILAQITAVEGQEVPVTQAIAVILAPGEQSNVPALSPAPKPGAPLPVSPLARRIAAEYQIDLSQITPAGQRIEKEDILAYLAKREMAGRLSEQARIPASPKARRLAAERGVNLATLKGSGPDGAVQAQDVLAASPGPTHPSPALASEGGEAQTLSTAWRIMAERTTKSWSGVPHFFLLREVNASRLISWRASLMARQEVKITYTDLLVRVVAAALKRHPAVNVAWQDGTIVRLAGIHVGLVTALQDGLVVPVIHNADQLSVPQIASIRTELVERARAGRLRLQDITGGTFTISNLGMYGVDAFIAIINQPQAAILAVGRIAERIIAVKGVPTAQPMLTLSLSCDHRAVDGARAAQFLDTIASFIEEPASLID